jgi:anhydro-N-acetylmuramic acid kinase
MIYKVIGIMSGSSLDGLDITFSTINTVGANWEYQVEYAETVPYTEEWISKLKNAQNLKVDDFLILHTTYGRYIGNIINQFINKNDLFHKVHFIATHGHTAYHNPEKNVSFQLGDGASIAAQTGITTISDLRNVDIAYQGQGAPIVPIADQLLFKDYKYCLNIGGIANISIKDNNNIYAFDICAANQILNHFANQANLPYDNKGELAAQGVCDDDILLQLRAIPFFSQKGPKSLNNQFSITHIIPALAHLPTENALHTACQHIATEIFYAIKQYLSSNNNSTEKLLITGGGAHNTFLVTCIQNLLAPLNIEVIIPDEKTINFKESLAMSMIGVLRWREEINVLKSVTGASQDSIGGCIWLAN